ncbi:MAG TPA: Vms1/Ankzf1 family peptidyl-tRNA hydrolase [Acidimicrobiales bacterium]|nr:Vms1/Ankzf1 family peptidyl-tRNA hydrolase [Acidimicrobiales bacterium]
MESAGTTPAVAVHAPDLAELAAQRGPFLTVYLATEGEVENAAQRTELRWKQVRDDLAEAGADDHLLAAVDALVPDAHHHGRCLCVVANTSGALHVEHNDELPKRDLGRWAPLPSLVPLLEWRQLGVPHVVVLIDRQGADLFAFRREGPDLRAESGGGADPLHKAEAGGWSQKRYQQRAENTWEKNADAVAADLAKLVDRINARVVAVAGDVRAVQLLREALRRDVADMLVEVEGGRAVDGSVDAVSDDVVRAVATVAARDTVALLEKFREEIGQGDRASDGVARTVEALSRAQVEVLLVADDPDDERTVWFGPEPTMLGLAADEVAGMGANPVQQGRLADVLVRAALGTGAAVRVVPGHGGPREGVGAILRWS